MHRKDHLNAQSGEKDQKSEGHARAREPRVRIRVELTTWAANRYRYPHGGDTLVIRGVGIPKISGYTDQNVFRKFS